MASKPTTRLKTKRMGKSNPGEDPGTVLHLSSSSPKITIVILRIVFCFMLFALCAGICAMKFGVLCALYFMIAAVIAVLGLLGLFIIVSVYRVVLFMLVDSNAPA